MQGDIIKTPTTEVPLTIPFVEIEGQLQPNVFCLTIEDTIGIIPGRAVFRVGADLTGPQTLNLAPLNIIPGQRVRVYINLGEGLTSTLFLGSIMERHDQGQQDACLWTAYDDRELLQKIWVHGALVYDSALKGAANEVKFAANEVKFIERHEARFNPDGLWNCCYASVNSSVWPVFTEVERIGANYETPEASYFNSALASHVLTAWTPRRVLQYLCCLCNLPADIAPGSIKAEWRSLANSIRLAWADTSISGISGKAPGATSGAEADFDPLDRKMPEMNFQGKNMLIAINETLRAAGTHDFRLSYPAEPTTTNGANWKSNLDFCSIGFTANRINGSMITSVLNLQRGGVADDVNTAYDFSLNENYSQVAEAVLVKGDIARLETSVEYIPGSATCILRQAWTADEEAAFKFIDNGSATAEPTTGTQRYAAYPVTQGSTATSTYVTADGQDGHLLVYARTQESLELARLNFPYVYRGFYIDSAKLAAAGKTNGVDSKFSDTSKYPVLSCKRPILAEQLQFFINDLTGSDEQTNWIRAKYPIRVQLKSVGESTYHDGPWMSGIKVTPEGIILLDNLAEAAEGTEQDCIYDGVLYTDATRSPIEAKMKYIKLNVAMPLDHRVTGLATIADKADSVFSESYYNDLGGPSIFYIDSPGAYHESHQVSSEPTSATSFYSGSQTISSPLTRYLPPGSEEVYAGHAATRRLWSVRQPRRHSSWRLPGIRTEYPAGTWIDEIKVRGFVAPDGDERIDSNYAIESSLPSVVYVFGADGAKQETILGGITEDVMGELS
jgi:hypothetical protein